MSQSLVGYEAPFEVAAAVRSVNASVSASPDDAVVMAQLQGLNAGANALPDLSGPTASTKDAAETTTSIQDTDSLVGDWNSLHGAIDISTLSGVRGELQSFNDTRAEVNGDTVESAQSQLETITQFMEEDLAGHLARLTVRGPDCMLAPSSSSFSSSTSPLHRCSDQEKHLASVFERGGVGAQLREVADVLDAITANLTDGSGTDMASLLSVRRTLAGAPSRCSAEPLPHSGPAHRACWTSRTGWTTPPPTQPAARPTPRRCLASAAC